MKLFYWFAIFMGFCISVHAQEIKGKILDANTREPVPFASIQYAKNKGVISNEEGDFSFYRGPYDFSKIKVSSVGYATLDFDFQTASSSIIYLQPEQIKLADVYLSNKNLSADEIIERVKESVQENYNFNNTEKRFFLRESNFNIVRQFGLKVNESSITELNQELMDKVAASVPKNSDSYKEVLGDFYGNYSTFKIQPVKAANLYNPQSTESLTDLSNRLEKIFQKNVKKSSYLKIKSGIVGFKVDAHEFQDEMQKPSDSLEKLEKSAEEKIKDSLQSKKHLQNSSLVQINSLFKTMFWKEDVPFDVFQKSRKYRFEVAGYTTLDSAMVYVINFGPKHGADFKGKMYVNTSDFGIYRLDYENVKPLKKFSIFGISTKNDVYRGKMIFGKDETGHYNPKYIELENGQTVGISRPLTIIEKNKIVTGKRKQNELDLDIDFRISQIDKHQFVVFDSKPIADTNLKNINPSSDFIYKTFKKYDPEFWSDSAIIEPNAAIKAFTVPESE